MSLRRYPEYRDGGVDWLRRVPVHWDVGRLRQAASVNDDTLPESTLPGFELQYVDIGSVSLERGIERTERLNFSGAPSRARRIVRDGDVLVSTVRTYLKAIAPVLNPPDNMVVSTGFAVIRPRRSLFPAFAKYVLQTAGFVEEVIARSTGISYPAINASDLVRIPIPLPAIAEQERIATFLDRETAKIDALIAEQEKLTALLAEKRQAAISHAVTRGLNPNAPMKDSGVTSLGELPAHWEVKQMRYVASVVRGASPRPAGDPAFFASDPRDGLNTPWVTVAEVTKDDAMYLTDVTEFLTPLGVERSQSFRAGTLIFTNSGATLGVPKILGIDCCANDGIVAFKDLDSGVDIRFLYFFLRTTTERLRTEMRQGGGQPNLNTGIVKDISFGLPSLEEQGAIADFLNGQLRTLDALSAAMDMAKNLLRERRASLITAAVTGQIDVRGEVQALSPEPVEAIA